MIPFLDLGAMYSEIGVQIESAVMRVLRSGRYILGEEVDLFERDYSASVGARHCIGVANGLDALTLALHALDVGPGDEVIVPSNTFIATWLAVSHCGAVPVPVEPDVLSYNIDPGRIEAAITPRTKVILPVHLYGRPADMTSINNLAQRHGLRVLEDAAQAHGAIDTGRRVGAGENPVAWSFYPGKNLGAVGDAGAVTTNDESLAEKILLLRNYGSRSKYVNEVRGFNSRIDPVQAAVLRVKLSYLDEWNRRRRDIAAVYRQSLAAANLTLPSVIPTVDPSWHLFVVRHPDRDALGKRLLQDGIETSIHYPIPPHRQKAYSELSIPHLGYPLADRLADEVLSLPIGPHLSRTAAEKVVDSVRAFCGTR